MPLSKRCPPIVLPTRSGGSVVGADDHAIFGPALREYLQMPLRRRPGLHVASAYRFDRQGYRLLWREEADSFNVRCGSSSIAETYAAVANYVFGSWQSSGKLMGLAPYGNAEAYGPSLLVRDAEGRLQFRADWKLRESRALDPGAPLEHLIDRDSIVNSRMAETNATGFSVDSVEVAHARLDSLTPPRVQFDADVHYTGEQMVERMFAGDRVTARLQGYVVFDDERWTVEDDCQVEVEIDSPDD